jgi:hypothetical protein
MKIFIVTAIICISASCNYFDKNRERENVKNVLKTWIGKEVYLSNLSIHGEAIGNKKIIIYVDSTDCTECRLHIQEWKLKIRELNNRVNFIFIVNPKNYKMAKAVFYREKLESMLFMDNNYEFKNKNKLPDDVRYHVFLLDEKNRVILIGNPVDNPPMWELFREQVIKDKTSQEKNFTMIMK